MKSELPKISIVLLNFSSGHKYLQETLPAIESLNYPDKEVIVIENGSTDKSLDYVRTFKDINIVFSPRLGEKNAACNYGIRQAQGEYILLLDNDLLIKDKNLLNQLIEFVNNKPHFGCCSLSFIDRDNKIQGYGGYFGIFFNLPLKKISEEQIKRMHGNKIGYPQGAGIFIKKSVWEEVGGYDEFLPFGGDDNDLGIRLWLSGRENYLFAKSVQEHIGSAERADKKKYARKFKNMFYAQLYTVIKNYQILLMIKVTTIFTCFMFIKAIRQSITKKSFKIIISFFESLILIAKNIPYAFKVRSQIQKTRIIKNDIFINIKPTYDK